MKNLIILLIMFWLTLPAEGQNITTAEYFIDTDPGLGNGTPVSITTPSANVVNTTFNFNTGALGVGFHRVYVRTKDANGRWSHTANQLFYKIDDSTGPLPNITAAEYFVDNDPGFGSGTPISVSPGINIVNVQFNAAFSGVSPGFHRVYLRTKDVDGKWSHTDYLVFYRNAAALIPQTITEVEYFIDIDPGMGQAVPVAVNSATNMVDSIFPINISGLSNGEHRFYIRTRDTKGSWSHTNDTTFTVSAAVVSPTILVNKVTRHEMCAGDTFRISYDAQGTYTPGNVFNAELSNATGSFASPTIIGSFTGIVSAILYCKLPAHLPDGTGYKVRVSSTTLAVAGLTAADLLTIHDRPYAQTITGDANVNQGYSYPYSSPAATGSTWAWIAPAATITQTTNSASLLWNNIGQPQQLKIVETNQYGCVGDTSSKPVNVYPLMITEVTPSNLTPCPDGSLTIAAKAFGVYYSGNVFTAQLSNSTGSFATPVTIGTLTPAPQPLGNAQPITINAKMPYPLANGTNYRIRILSSNYAKTSDTSAAIIVNKPDLGADQTLTKCVGYPVNLTTVFTTTGLDTSWDVVRADSVVTPGTYRLIVTNQYGCKDTAMVTVSDYPQPAPNYTINNTGQCASGNSFVFTNTSTISGGSMTYQWSFGDNTSSTSASPTHSYSAPGTYSIRLIITSNNGCIDSIKKIVTVFPQPVAAFTNNTANQCLNGNAYTFSNTSTISSGSITTHQWTFGDNSGSTDASPTHTYLSAGTFTVKLVETSSNGCKDSITQQVTVYPKPSPNFTINTASQCASGNSFVYTNTSTMSAGSMTYQWSFGDGTTSTATSPTHSYGGIGDFTVKLVVMSNNGCKDSISKTITVFPQPVAVFTINALGQCLNGNDFNFTNSSTVGSGSITGYQWTFGDNTGSTAASPTHVYGAAGSFTVKLVVTSNNGCKDSISQTVTVYPKPVPGFSINNISQCASGNSFVFTNTSTISAGSMTYQWSFGDGTTSAATSATHSYSGTGDYTVKLVATSNNGCKDSITKTITVFPQPVAAFTINALGQCLNGNDFNFTNSSTVSSGSITGYQWTFGDNTGSTAASPTHVYGAAGSFTVKLIVTSNNGCKDSISQTVTVYLKPVPGFSINNISQCASSNSFVYTNTSTIGAGSMTYQWSFGDGTTSTATSATHSYSGTGDYTVKLVATSNNGCRDSISKTITVYAQPQAAFTINNSSQCINGNSFAFTSTSTAGSGTITTYQWSFGDNTSATGSSPMHMYTSVANYTVKLVVTNSNGCKDSTTQMVAVNVKPNLGADTSITLACQGGTADLTGVYNTVGYSNVAYNTATPTMVAAGMYEVYVTNSSGCKDTAIISVLPAIIASVPTMPNQMVLASRECTDADGWTHYYNDNGTPNNYSDDIRVFSIRKNGNNIGTVGDGTFNITVAATSGANSGHAVKVTSPLVEAGVDYYSMNRYWKITPTTQPTGPVNVRFYFNAADISDINGDFPGNGLTPAMLTLHKLTGGNPDPTSNWAGATGVQYYENGASPSLTHWAFTNLGNNLHQAEFLVDAFSGGGAGGKAFQTLPIQLVKFDVVNQKTKISLSWSTASESNSKEFLVQRSLDAIRFETIGKVIAAGNSTELKQYRFDDTQAPLLFNGSKVYYRIEMVDKNNAGKLTMVKNVRIDNNINILKLQFNPVQNLAILKYQCFETDKMMLRVIDQSGRVVIMKAVSVDAGSNQLEINTGALAQGIYEVELLSKKDRQHVRMVKE